jgi:hypothetical protein
LPINIVSFIDNIFYQLGRYFYTLNYGYTIFQDMVKTNYSIEHISQSCSILRHCSRNTVAKIMLDIISLVSSPHFHTFAPRMSCPRVMGFCSRPLSGNIILTDIAEKYYQHKYSLIMIQYYDTPLELTPQLLESKLS